MSPGYRDLALWTTCSESTVGEIAANIFYLIGRILMTGTVVIFPVSIQFFFLLLLLYSNKTATWLTIVVKSYLWITKCMLISEGLKNDIYIVYWN